MIKFIKNYGVFIAEFISAIILFAFIYFGLKFLCIINDKCFNLYFGGLV